MRLPVYREIVGADVMAIVRGGGLSEVVLERRIIIPNGNCAIAVGRRVLIGCLTLGRVRVRVKVIGLGFRVRVVLCGSGLGAKVRLRAHTG